MYTEEQNRRFILCGRLHFDDDFESAICYLDGMSENAKEYLFALAELAHSFNKGMLKISLSEQETQEVSRILTELTLVEGVTFEDRMIALSKVRKYIFVPIARDKRTPNINIFDDIDLRVAIIYDLLDSKQLSPYDIGFLLSQIKHSDQFDDVHYLLAEELCRNPETNSRHLEVALYDISFSKKVNAIELLLSELLVCDDLTKRQLDSIVRNIRNMEIPIDEALMELLAEKYIQCPEDEFGLDW